MERREKEELRADLARASKGDRGMLERQPARHHPRGHVPRRGGLGLLHRRWAAEDAAVACTGQTSTTPSLSAPRAGYERHVNHDPACLFCRLVAGLVPRSVVYEDEDVLAFMDLYPVTRGHLLVVPRGHYVVLEDCPPAVASALVVTVQRLNRAVREALACEGVLNEVMNGSAAGQEIFHAHFHVIPRWEGDGFGWVYPDGYRSGEAPRRELDALAGALRGALGEGDESTTPTATRVRPGR